MCLERSITESKKEGKRKGIEKGCDIVCLMILDESCRCSFLILFLLNIVELWLVVVVVVSVNFLSRQVCLFVCLLIKWCTKYGSKVALLYEPCYSCCFIHIYIYEILLYVSLSSKEFSELVQVLWVSGFESEIVRTTQTVLLPN